MLQGYQCMASPPNKPIVGTESYGISSTNVHSSVYQGNVTILGLV